ncbi:MAG: MinD/ParA family protein [Nitrospinae bacterium]|nr:MinD/ParA family protein [Nitrospinota bacterium]
MSGTRVITVTSGKGGVGKTNISTNLAYAFTQIGKKVYIFDADLGLANINVLLGVNPEYDLQHVILGDKELKDIIIDGPGGMKIIPASSGVQQLAELSAEERERLLSKLNSLNLEGEADILLIDTSAGISSNVTSFVLASEEVIIIVTPEPTSLTDAYAMIKVIVSKNFKGDIKILLNQVSTEAESKKIFQKLAHTVKKFLKIDIESLGYILIDKNMTEAVKQQRLFLSLYPSSPASRCITNLANHICNLPIPSYYVQEGVSGFWKRAFNLMKKAVISPQKKEGVIPEVKVKEVEEADQLPPPSISISKRFEKFKGFIINELQKTSYSHEDLKELSLYLSNCAGLKNIESVAKEDIIEPIQEMQNLIKRLEKLSKEESNVVESLLKIKENGTILKGTMNVSPSDSSRYVEKLDFEEFIKDKHLVAV